MKNTSISLATARLVKEHILSNMKDAPEVVGVGICRVADGYGVKINIDSSKLEDADMGKYFDGIHVVINVVGTVHARTGKRVSKASAIKQPVAQ